MRILASLLCLCFCLGSGLAVVAAAPPDSASTPGQPGNTNRSTPDRDTLVVGISPFLDAAVKDAVFRSLVRLIVADLPLKSKLEIHDAYNLRLIARVAIPDLPVFHSPKTRANQFAGAIGELKQFLARDNARPEGARPGSFTAAIRLPQFCEFLTQDHPPTEDAGRPAVLLIGSPLYEDAREPAFSMVGGYFPSDGHLRASREQSVYGLNQVEHSPPGPQVYWAYFGDPWLSDLHREKVARFWTLYLERRGGRLASFSADLATALAAFTAGLPGQTAAAHGWTADSRTTKLEMLRASRTVQQVDWLTGEAPESSPPPTQMVGPLKIGIRWSEDIDLDLYAAPGREAEFLFFQHPRSSEGYYFKDQRSSPGREYEFIEFETPVDVRQLRAFVNFYEGSRPGGPHGEVRIEFQNRIYSGRFSIAAATGNEGRSGQSQGAHWTKIPVLDILGISAPPTQAAASH